MRITKKDGTSVSFDISKIVDAVSKAWIRQEEKKVEEDTRIVELFAGVGGVEGDPELYQQLLDSILDRILNGYNTEDYYCLQLELERLDEQRKQLRALRRLKTERVSQMIRTAWMNRNNTVGRSNTGAVTDPMLLSIPTPPTSEAANRSLGCGGMVLAYNG